MGHDQRQRVLMPGLHVDEVDLDPVDLGRELRKRVQSRRAPAPVVLARPVAGELLQRLVLHALRSVGDELLVGPARRRDAPAQVVDLLLWNLYLEWPNIGLAVDGGAHDGSLLSDTIEPARLRCPSHPSKSRVCSLASRSPRSVRGGGRRRRGRASPSRRGSGRRTTATTAGMPRSSRYQLRQPVTQIVCFAASTRVGFERLRRARASALISRHSPDAQPVDELHDVAELQLGDLDQREVADRAVRAVEHEEVREVRDRDRQVRVGPRRPRRRRASTPSRPMTVHRPHERVGLEAGREHEHVELVEHAVAACARPRGSIRSIAVGDELGVRAAGSPRRSSGEMTSRLHAAR